MSVGGAVSRDEVLRLRSRTVTGEDSLASGTSNPLGSGYLPRTAV